MREAHGSCSTAEGHKGNTSAARRVQKHTPTSRQDSYDNIWYLPREVYDVLMIISISILWYIDTEYFIRMHMYILHYSLLYCAILCNILCFFKKKNFTYTVLLYNLYMYEIELKWIDIPRPRTKYQTRTYWNYGQALWFDRNLAVRRIYHHHHHHHHHHQHYSSPKQTKDSHPISFPIN